MNDDKTLELLIQLVADMSFVKSKLVSIEEQHLSTRLDTVENKTAEHDRVIPSLERRCNEMEKFVRNNLQENNRRHISTFVSMGLAVFSAIVTLIFNLFM